MSVLVGIGALLACAVGTLVYLVWRANRRRRLAEAASGSMRSLVLLLREPRGLDVPLVRAMACQAWNTTISDQEDDETWVIGELPLFVIKCEESLHVVNVFPIPYFEKLEQMIEDVRDLRLRKALAEHTAWISVDLMNSDSSEDATAQYARIGSLLAEFCDENALAVLCPAREVAYVVDDSTVQHLRSSDPLRALQEASNPPVLTVADHERLQATVTEARRRFPEFVAAFEARQPDDTFFSVKARFTHEEAVEFMWVNVTALEGGTAYGTLGNEPVDIPLKIEDRVTVRVEEICDWVYLQGDQIVGGFSFELFRDQAEGGESPA